MSKPYAVVLSDVHIGDNSPTNWYQASVHEPRLVELLDWVVDHASEIRELILLGDLVDIWTYPPDVEPPTMAQIIAANPNTLGPGGALARAVAALPGQVTLLLGNHDGQLTQADLDALYGAVGQLNFVPGGVHTVTGDSGASTTFAHGHLWTMFNAPDPNSPWNELPVGHFVTRAFAYHLQKTLQPGQTAADLPGMGSPNGFDLSSFLSSLSPSSLDVAGALLNYVATAAVMPTDTPIVLPGGTTVSYSDAYNAYENLFSRWAQQWGSTTAALRAACADQWGKYLVWYAQRLAIEQTSNLVVFGHTHQPVSGIAPSPVNYINSGYECVSNPDMPAAEFTFTLVDLEAASGQIFQLAPSGQGGPQPFPAPVLPPIVAPAMDFSCYATVTNQTGGALTLDALQPPAYGTWVVPPPPSIAPGASAMIWLQDNTGPHGSEGAFSYNNGSLKFSFECPTGLWPNSCSGPNGNFVARSGTSGWGARGSCPSWGHPLQIKYTVA